MLEIAGLEVEFRTQRGVVRAVDGVDLALEAGSTTGLVGESGSGKSVTALAIMGLLPEPAARVIGGSIRLDGVELVGMPEAQLRRRRGSEVAMVFQDPMTSLNPVMPIGAQIVETLRAHLRHDRRAARRRAVELLDFVGIPGPSERLASYPHQLSGGMRQRVMIAIAIACEPKLLIADEPTTALDVTIQAQILELLRRTVDERGMTLLLITHDLGVVAGVCDRTNVMYAGKVVERAPTAALFRAPSHHYTRGLLQSIPRLDGPRKTILASIGGLPPRPSDGLRGCPFAPRCPARLDDRCWDEMPPLERLPGATAAHLVACWNPAPVPDERASA